MKQLLLIRHAKSSWDFPGASDHDRPLNGRGERDAPAMGAALRQRGVMPDAIISSTANRAMSTALFISDGLGFKAANIQTSRDLYLASPRTIFQTAQQCDESVNTLLLFGHNPGMHEATNLLANDRGVDRFPTLAVARFELDIEYWGNLEPHSGLLVELLTPKGLKEE